MRSRAAPRPPWGCARARRPLLLVALGAACLRAASPRLSPAFAAGSGAGCSLRGLQPASRRTVARTAASELEEQTAKAPPKVAIADLEVGQTVEGRVTDTHAYGVFVDIKAERNGLVRAEELSDKGVPEWLKRGSKVTTRVLKVVDGKLWLTLRSGDLARPSGDFSPKARKGDLSPFVGAPADQWFDGEVQGFLHGMGAVVAVEVPGTSDLPSGLLKKGELGEGLVDSIHVGMKVRVRVLACDAEKGTLDLTAKEP